MKDIILGEAKGLGIDIIGFTDGEVFSELQPVIKDRLDKGFISSFFHVDIEQNTNPLIVWKDTKSIISIGVSYKHKLDETKIDKSRCSISRVAWGQDYHNILLEKMNRLMSNITREYPDIKYKAYVDNAPLLDRAVAHRSGLGFYGKNGFIINKLYGSYIFLGHILTNIELGKSSELDDCTTCRFCSRCIQACPTGAIKEGYDFNSNKCISFFTQKKELLSREERKYIGKMVYGCDICQEVCPINKTAKYSNEAAFVPLKDVVRPKIKDIINMDNAMFKNIYKSSSAGWRGKKILQRNAIIVAGNIKTEENYQLLKQTLNDSRWDIRMYSMFSLLEYGERGMNEIKEKLNGEDEEFRKNFNIYC
ncbi:tRNA epoxyqueuosine(34) reductase QueG [Alkalibaculum sporogenes]|uniref:tRNA epoxyqueuosine(34) reductase QueG n=1 Tax=Alkalibaculum sporogenes TaxID=2655001 RepID=UPI00128D5158|nr:tRNA epoxyqueuosine(34) reductase QueG [Alkalibaculum sporogenes]